MCVAGWVVCVMRRAVRVVPACLCLVSIAVWRFFANVFAHIARRFSTLIPKTLQLVCKHTRARDSLLSVPSDDDNEDDDDTATRTTMSNKNVREMKLLAAAARKHTAAGAAVAHLNNEHTLFVHALKNRKQTRGGQTQAARTRR